MKNFILASALVGFGAVAATPALSDEEIDKMCADLGKTAGSALAECRTDEQDAHQDVADWLAQYALLTDDNDIDYDKIDAASDDDSPAGIAGYCIEQTQDWVDLADCLDSLDPSDDDSDSTTQIEKI